jgi:integrase
MGAIRKRGKHYEIRYYDGVGRRRSEVVGPNLHEARQVLAQREWERRNGKFHLTRQPITMAEFVAKWRADYLGVQLQLGRMKESTIVGYQNNLRHHIEPFFGRTRLDAIGLPHVREFVKALLATQRSPATVLKVVALLKEMFKHAVQWGYLDANPAQYVERPRVEVTEMEVLTPPEIHRLLAAAEEPLRTLLLCAVLTGMRRGELLGLRWEDIDLEGGPPPRAAGALAGEVRDAQVAPVPARDRPGPDPPGGPGATAEPLSGRVGLRGGRRQPMDPDNFIHREWARVLRRAQLGRIRFHDLRHTYASLLIAQGAHPKYIQAQLGHASIQTTLDRYGHLMPELHAAEARKLDRLVFGAERAAGEASGMTSGQETPRTPPA